MSHCLWYTDASFFSSNHQKAQTNLPTSPQINLIPKFEIAKFFVLIIEFYSKQKRLARHACSRYRLQYLLFFCPHYSLSSEFGMWVASQEHKHDYFKQMNQVLLSYIFREYAELRRSLWVHFSSKVKVTKKPPATLNLFLLPARPRSSALDYEVIVICVTGNLIMLFLKLLISCDLTRLRCVTLLPGYLYLLHLLW
jgi:hypothetical protein